MTKGSVKMYNINIEQNFHFLSWDVIYWGIKNDLLMPKSAVDFAHKSAENAESNGLCIELIILDEVTKNNILSLIDKFVIKEKSEKDALQILKFIILKDIRKNADIDIILEEAEKVYADFDYPQDMKSFIRYMPVEDDFNLAEHSDMDCKKRLLKNLDVFLSKFM